MRKPLAMKTWCRSDALHLHAARPGRQADILLGELITQRTNLLHA
jgi:hypothetical protein